MANEDGVALQNSDADVLKELHDLTQKVQELQARNKTVEMRPEDREQMQKLTDAVGEVAKKMGSRTASRQSEFQVDPDRRESLGIRDKTVGEYLSKKLTETPSGVDAEATREFQDKCDDAYLVSKLMNKDIRELDCYRDLSKLEIGGQLATAGIRCCSLRKSTSSFG
jgi:hypothetical protein